MVNNHRGYILHKTNHKKGRKHDYDIQYKEESSCHPQKKLLMYLILDISVVEKDFPEQLSALPYKKKRNYKSDHMKKKSITKFILKRE